MEEVFRWYATIGTIVAAVVVAARLSPLLTGWAFVLFTSASLAWIAAGVLADESSLVVQNLVLTAVNLFGVWRWLLRSPKSAA